ncbi:alpha-amylase family glycosyl hydrolase [Marilutibacter chinensis]|uniref:Alpha-glucosidase n=1 Tax=Marilutibacter chinensis TaxID=2912247 RepID=A0ABS9HPW1_9GAMM|nr:alpha-amylase family glycosyl hydrolase [Lysobacter chinensis]MCF7220648.1 alpha-glucosidase [Lysobacter chinensis]
MNRSSPAPYLPWWRATTVETARPAALRRGDGLPRGHWWHNSVIYQLTPWSYQDSDGDGKGDLPGLIRRVDYLASLGVDAVWLTPIYGSPMDDLGYDVTRTRQIDPLFGDIGDFRRLLTLMHQRGLKLVLDLVLNHTSDQHRWFTESRGSRDNPRADWYIWADPAEDGGPPNNWPSVLTGKSGWKFEPARGQYYFYNFLPSQPDLNWHNPAVREAQLDTVRFWLEEGIDGIRLDAVNFYCHDPELKDNPLRTDSDGRPDGIAPDNPAAQQVFSRSFCRPETHDCLKPLRELVDRHPGTMLLGEVTLCEDTIREAAEFTHGSDRLHIAYHSALLFHAPATAQRLKSIILRTQQEYGARGNCWMAGNHDYGRMRDLWGGGDHDDPDAFYRMMAALLLAAPGALCLWQGDELGLPSARIPEDIGEDQLRDPFGRAMYPTLPGRDGSRTPMPWDCDDGDHCGFSEVEPWLPIPASHRGLSVAAQSADPDSSLNTWRNLLHWRRAQPALLEGALRMLDLPAPGLGWWREHDVQGVLAVFNVSPRPLELDLAACGDNGSADALERLEPAWLHGCDAEWNPATRRLALPPWGVWFAACGKDATSGREA